jgi:hypothetical protein
MKTIIEPLSDKSKDAVDKYVYSLPCYQKYFGKKEDMKIVVNIVQLKKCLDE